MTTSIRNIVIACPGSDYDGYVQAARGLASFYGELLGMTTIRDDWVVIAKDDTLPRIAFGDGPGDYRPPRWPDPEHPQQVHVDIAVDDVDAAEASVLRLGATQLQDKGSYRSYADPVGHPFCLYRDEGARASARRIGRVVFDCLSPRALAAFYQPLMGMPVRTEDSPERVVIAAEDGGQPMLGFQHSVHAPPRWPDPAYPQQIHLDVHVDDSDRAQDLALRLGAIRLPSMGGSCPVYADPAGHPFCLCATGQ